MNFADEPADGLSLRAYAPAWWTLAVGLAASLVAAWWFWREAEQLDKTRFETTVTNVIEQLEARTARYAEELKRFADFLGAQSEVTVNIWQECISRPAPPGSLPAFTELAYVANLSLPSREDIEALLKEGRARQSGKPLLPEWGPADLDLRVRHHWRNGCTLTPEDTQVWLQQPQISAWWWSTLDGRLISSPRRLMPDLNGKPIAGVSFFVPIFAEDLLALIEQHSSDELWRLRARRFKGMVLGTIRWQPFRDAVFATSGGQVAFEAFAAAISAAEMTAENWLGVGEGAESQVLAPNFQPRFKHMQSWPFYRARWQLAFYSTELFDKHSTRGRAWFAFGTGMSMTILMASLLAVQVHARRKQEMISNELRAALDQLDTARKQREQLSYDLHDGAIQSLYALQLSLSACVEQTQPVLPILSKRLSDIRRNVTAVIGELRTFILRHEAGCGPTGDLTTVLNALVERSRSYTETTLRAHLSAEASRRLSSEQAVHLANLAREALSNALRHAEARSVTINLRAEPNRIVLEIEDDGRGFDRESPIHSGLGMASMAARAREAGGELRIDSRREQGTRVTVFVPVTPAA